LLIVLECHGQDVFIDALATTQVDLSVDPFSLQDALTDGQHPIMSSFWSSLAHLFITLPIWNVDRWLFKVLLRI